MKTKNIYEELREIELLARKKFGDITPGDCYLYLIKEIGELFALSFLKDYPAELFDILAWGYSFYVNHDGATHEDFVEIFEEKINIVKERMRQ